LLGPSGDLQGGYKFMALNTRKKITCWSWDMIPMLDTVNWFTWWNISVACTCCHWS
jgi:hypothetical protein